MHHYLTTVLQQLIDNVHHFGVAQVGAVFLKCQTQYSNLSATHPVAVLHQSLDRLLSHKLSHVIICLTPSQNNLRMVANRLCLIRQIVGVDTNTVASDQAGPEREKIPFAACCFQNIKRINTQPVKNHRQFIHKRNIKISLRIFNNLGGFSNFNSGRPMSARRHYPAIESGYFVECFRCVPGNNFDDCFQAMLLVSRVNALGRVANIKATLDVSAIGVPARPR